MTGNGNEIVTVSRTLLLLLAQHCPRNIYDLAAEDFRVAQFADLAERPPHRGVTLVLYRVAMNMSARSQSPRRGVSESIAPPLALDLHYLLTPWAESAETQQRLLGWALAFLDKQSRIDARLLNQVEPGAFRDNVAVQLLLESLPPAEHLAVLGQARRPLPSSATYLARLTLT